MEVLDRTNVPWASSISAVWCYLLGLSFPSWVSMQKLQSFSLCLRISPKQRLDRGRALVWNRDALGPQSSVSSVRVPLRLDLERASWRETSCACPNPRLILYAVLLGRSSASTDDVWSSVVIQRGEKLSYHHQWNVVCRGLCSILVSGLWYTFRNEDVWVKRVARSLIPHCDQSSESQ